MDGLLPPRALVKQKLMQKLHEPEKAAADALGGAPPGHEFAFRCYSIENKVEQSGARKQK